MFKSKKKQKVKVPNRNPLSGPMLSIIQNLPKIDGKSDIVIE